MIIFDGSRIEIPGVVSTCPDDDARLQMQPHCGARRPAGSRPHCFVVHTTKGIPGGKKTTPQRLLPGKGAPGNAAEANAYYWNGLKGADYAGAALVIDRDGSLVNTCDVVRDQTWHATSVNAVSIGIEIVQADDATLYASQCDTLVATIVELSRRLGIQLQYHAPYHGSARPVPRFASGAHDVYGVFGHRDQTTNRGAGDPGDFVFDALRAAGFEAFDFARDEDKQVWRARQRDLGVAAEDCDGVPGPQTVARLRSYAYVDGLWALGVRIDAAR